MTTAPGDYQARVAGRNGTVWRVQLWLVSNPDTAKWTEPMRAELLDFPAGETHCRRLEAGAMIQLNRDNPLVRQRLTMLLGDRVIDDQLESELGLRRPDGTPIMGLPLMDWTTEACCLRAAMRGALLASGRLVTPGERWYVVVDLPNSALRLVSLTKRLGFRGSGRGQRDQVVFEDGLSLLKELGITRFVGTQD